MLSFSATTSTTADDEGDLSLVFWCDSAALRTTSATACWHYEDGDDESCMLCVSSRDVNDVVAATMTAIQ